MSAVASTSSSEPEVTIDQRPTRLVIGRPVGYTQEQEHSGTFEDDPGSTRTLGNCEDKLGPLCHSPTLNLSHGAARALSPGLEEAEGRNPVGEVDPGAAPHQ